MSIYSVIEATGTYIPERVMNNSKFHRRIFYNPNGSVMDKSSKEIVDKFQEITDIESRRYVDDNLVNSEIATYAALNALATSRIDGETLDCIIVAHNFGDVKHKNRRTDMVPSLAARVKKGLEIDNPQCVARDVIFGCPGWVQGVIDADYMIRSGRVRRVMVIGTEILSRISDPHDRDSLLYADGAGATIFVGKESDRPIGILSHAVRSDTKYHSSMLTMGKSYNPNYSKNDLFLKMNGRKLYDYALRNVPKVVKESMEKAGLTLQDITKVLMHQANGKLDAAILERLFKLYKIEEIPEGVMPMTISWLGNSSVATIPTLLDLIWKGKLKGHALNHGDNIVLASVGAGMNINSIVYRMP